MNRSWSAPQPFETVDHTADTGVRVTGASPEETLARLVLGHAQMLAGGVEVEQQGEAAIAVEGAGDLSLVAVDLLREMNRLFCAARQIATTVTIEEVSAANVRLRVGYGHYDPSRHSEGLDIKAVTFHAAVFEQSADGWVAQVVFDI